MINKTIHIIAVSYQKINQLKVFVQSILNQTNSNWLLTVIHDGENSEFTEVMNEYKKISPDKIEFFCTDKRYNDYGHSLRQIGLQSDLNSDYVLITNADNYYIPKAVEFLNYVIDSTQDPDVIIYDMVHSHNTPGGRNQPAYSFFETQYKRNSIDIGAAIVKTELAKSAGFRDKSFSGDATYFEDIVKAKSPEKLRTYKMPIILFVHN